MRGTVEVAESLADLGGHLEFGATKNYARRHVPLPPFLRDELGEYLALSRRNTDDLVFSAPRGGPLRHGLFYRRTFKPAVLAAGLPEGLRFHDYADLRVMPTQPATPGSAVVSGLKRSA